MRSDSLPAAFWSCINYNEKGFTPYRRFWEEKMSSVNKTLNRKRSIWFISEGRSWEHHNTLLLPLYPQKAAHYSYLGSLAEGSSVSRLSTQATAGVGIANYALAQNCIWKWDKCFSYFWLQQVTSNFGRGCAAGKYIPACKENWDVYKPCSHYKLGYMVKTRNVDRTLTKLCFHYNIKIRIWE
jgi:hypothetical protein